MMSKDDRNRYAEYGFWVTIIGLIFFEVLWVFGLVKWVRWFIRTHPALAAAAFTMGGAAVIVKAFHDVRKLHGEHPR